VNSTDVLDPHSLGIADISIWIVEGDVGPVSGFKKVGGSNIRLRRIGAAAAPAVENDGLKSRLRTLQELRQEGTLSEPLYQRAAVHITSGSLMFTQCLK